MTNSAEELECHEDQQIAYYFICKNIPKESFSLSISNSDLSKSLMWLCAKAKDFYQNQQSIYKIDSNIENVFDNLGFFNYKTELNELEISKTFYFTAIPRHEGLDIQYQFSKDQKMHTSNLVVGKQQRLSDLRMMIAKSLQLNEQKIQLQYQGRLLQDESALLTDLGMKCEGNKNIVRVLQLIQIYLYPGHTYNCYQKNFSERKTFYLNPFQNLKQQITEKLNTPINQFILLNQNNQIVEQMEQIKDQDILVIRDITSGQYEVQLVLIEEDEINEPLLTQDAQDYEMVTSIKVYENDSIDLIRRIAQIILDNPYISCFAYMDLTQIKSKMLFKDLIFTEDTKKLYAVCQYQGEIVIVTRLKQSIPLKIDFKETVFGLKTILENKIGIDCLDQLMYFNGSLLEDSKNLTDYKICVGSRISVEENIFKESLRQKHIAENSNLDTQKSNSINMLYRINQKIDSKNMMQSDEEENNVYCEGINLVCSCVNQYCKQKYTDSEIVYKKGLGNHLIKFANDQTLKTLNCKRCLGPVKLQSIILKGCSIIFLEQTKENQIVYHFKWQFFSPLNIEPFKQYQQDCHALYFFVNEYNHTSLEKDQFLLNCLVCRNNQISIEDTDQFIHEQCKSEFPLNCKEVFSQF
ncbi:ubiquitin family protein (macronuclear) [Tetrahymena thermophila SB210]|uniref:Ubiquitin family protein n=1 Tax=Tetrahymena thermophila (strain SB210) TaxID=312017 RepID=I7LX46_TETTS|nr:ubiquitin family protein [Tetrahymena thermophila SB210]EAS03747.2 ubiquitin family protein [Tetrahymena thermophila SB210]|eukprot:XP_001023992.2 ubiquitin family protein [Tetrahymena thermophila SB210]